MNIGMARRIITLVLVVLALVTAFVGSGAVIGTPVNEAAGGWLDQDSTAIAPASGAFRIWSVIYLGLLGYAIWQLLRRSDSERHQSVRNWVLAGVVLNSVWLGTVQLGWLAVSVVVIAALLACLLRVLFLLSRQAPGNRLEALLLDGVQGLYLGWVLIATLANASAALASTGWSGAPLSPISWTIVLIAVATALSVALAGRLDGRLAPALSTAWGLVWIGVARSTGVGIQSTGITITAVAAAVVVLGAALAWRWARVSR